VALDRWKKWLGTTEPERAGVLALLPAGSDPACLRQAAERLALPLLVLRSLEEAIDLLPKQRFAIIVCDRDLPGFDWHDTVAALIALAPGSCVLLTSSVNDEYLWREVIQSGGYDVITKPLRAQQVEHALDLAWWYWKARASATK